jgi:DNA (cytosine-5)-methyltransferase 1
MKQQTFVTQPQCLNAWDTQQSRIFLPDGTAPTLKASPSGNMMPSVLCLNDQGGSVMECSHDVSGTLRAQEHGHQPLVMATQQGGAEIGVGICPTITASAGMSGNN